MPPVPQMHRDAFLDGLAEVPFTRLGAALVLGDAVVNGDPSQPDLKAFLATNFPDDEAAEVGARVDEIHAPYGFTRSPGGPPPERVLRAQYRDVQSRVTADALRFLGERELGYRADAKPLEQDCMTVLGHFFKHGEYKGRTVDELRAVYESARDFLHNRGRDLSLLYRAALVGSQISPEMGRQAARAADRQGVSHAKTADPRNLRLLLRDRMRAHVQAENEGADLNDFLWA